MTQEPRGRKGARTRAVHGPDPAPGPIATPVVFSATFAFPSLEAMEREQRKGPRSAYYARVGNPTVAAAERRVADLEGTESALLFSSGMAATSSMFLALMSRGDRIVALRECYGGTLELLEFGREHFGWQVSLVGAEEAAAWSAAIQPGTRIFHVESPTNPTLRLVDLRQAAALAHDRGAILTVDNTFASPVNQNPLALGADLVMHSATKYLGGHSDLLAGTVAGAAALLERVWKVRKIVGGVLDPLSASHLERSMKTLPLRVAASGKSALALAVALERHPAVERVNYPGLPSHPQHDLARRQMHGFGGMLSLVVRGGGDAARAVVESLRVFSHGPSLGSVESLAALPAFTSHAQLTPEERARAGIAEGLVRLSVGLEDEADLWADLEQALEKAVSVRA